MNEVKSLIDLKKYVDFKGIAQEICRLHPESQRTFTKDLNDSTVCISILVSDFNAQLIPEVISLEIKQRQEKRAAKIESNGVK